MKIKSTYLLLLALVCCALITAIAQQSQDGNTRIAALQKKLTGHANDTDKVKLLNGISYEYNKISPYDGIRYGIQSLALAEELHWQLGIAQANSCLGANYYSLSDLPNAYNYWLKALNINEEIGYKKGIANHLHNIGNIFFSQKNYTKALEYYEQGLKSSIEIGNKNLTTNSWSAIGNVYEALKNYPKALECHFNALAIDEELDLKSNIASDEVNIGSVYNEQGNYAKALEILFRALQIKKETGDKNGLAKTYNMIGKVFLHIASYVSTEKRDIATYGSMDKNLQHAVSYLDSAIIVDKEIGYLDNLQNSYEYLADADQMMNDSKDALSIYKQYDLIKDSIFSVQKQAEIFNLERKEEIEAKNRETEKEMEEKERQEYIQIGGICLFIVIFIPVILLLRHKRVNPQVIDVLGTVSVLIVFEFIELLIHGKIEKLTNHNLVLTLLCLLLLAGIIIPVHHRIEHWMKKKIGVK